MAGLTKFYQFITAFGTYRNMFLNRPLFNNCQQAATLRVQSKEKLKIFPEQPKKPMTAFFLFCQTHREELRKLHPNIKITQLAKILSEEWNKADEAVKKKYESEYKNAMIDYAKKKLEYNAKLTEEQKEILQEVKDEKNKDKLNRKIRKVWKETDKPKRPKGPFIFFVLEYYAKDEANLGKYSEFLKKSKTIWESLSMEEKKKFHDMYLDDKKRYELEMEHWEAKMIRDGNSDLVRQSTLIDMKPKRPIKAKDQTSKKPE